MDKESRDKPVDDKWTEGQVIMGRRNKVGKHEGWSGEA